MFQSFGQENVGKFIIVNISYFSESGIWLGKILANDVCFAKFAKVFHHQNFALCGFVKQNSSSKIWNAKFSVGKPSQLAKICKNCECFLSKALVYMRTVCKYVINLHGDSILQNYSNTADMCSYSHRKLYLLFLMCSYVAMY